MSLCEKKPAGSGGARGAGGGSTSGGESTATAPAAAGTSRARSAGGIRDEDANLEHCRVALTADIIPLLITLMTAAKDDEILMVCVPHSHSAP